MLIKFIDKLLFIMLSLKHTRVNKSKFLPLERRYYMDCTKLIGYRVMMKKTQKDFAALLNISTPAYNRKEKGITTFKPEEMLKIKEYINGKYPSISIDDLFFSL